MRWLISATFLLCLTLTASARAEATAPPACDQPAEFTTPSAPLAAVASALARKAPVEILALGSGSTVGEGGGSSGPVFTFKTPAASFPYRMLEALQELRPSAQFYLTVKGARNITAEAMLSAMRQELASHHFDLILWQTGTVEAVRGLRPDALNGVLQEGVAAAAEAHADVVLIDPQFSRFLRANTDLTPYEAVLEQAAGMPDVTLFHRFDLTQLWVGNGQIDLERVEHDQRDKTVALLNTCLGQALARYVLTGADQH